MNAVDGSPIFVRSAIHFPATAVYFFIRPTSVCLSRQDFQVHRCSSSSAPDAFRSSLRKRSVSAGPWFRF